MCRYSRLLPTESTRQPSFLSIAGDKLGASDDSNDEGKPCAMDHRHSTKAPSVLHRCDGRCLFNHAIHNSTTKRKGRIPCRLHNDHSSVFTSINVASLFICAIRTRNQITDAVECQIAYVDGCRVRLDFDEVGRRVGIGLVRPCPNRRRCKQI